MSNKVDLTKKYDYKAKYFIFLVNRISKSFHQTIHVLK